MQLVGLGASKGFDPLKSWCSCLLPIEQGRIMCAGLLFNGWHLIPGLM